MKRTARKLALLEAAMAAVAVTLGWAAFADQLDQDGWTSGGGTLWILIAAAGATAGGTIAIVARTSRRHFWTAIGLAAAAVSPTVFAYLPNLVLIVLAIVEARIGIGLRRRTPSLMQ